MHSLKLTSFAAVLLVLATLTVRDSIASAVQFDAVAVIALEIFILTGCREREREGD